MKYREFGISRTNDCDENEGGLFCQVYSDCDCSYEIDNFCLHKEELNNKSEELLIKEYIDNNFENLFRLANKAQCNMCDGEHLIHTQYKGTHIWTCEDCPNIQYEHVEPKDLDNLVEFMRERGN